MFKVCPFCHQQILSIFYPIHRLKHVSRQDDGQMNDHISVHPSHRYDGDLDDVPVTYWHAKCDSYNES